MIAGSRGELLNFGRDGQTAVQSARASCCPTSSEGELLLLRVLATFGVGSVLDLGHFNRCVAVSHCYFNLQFLNDVVK